jgi:hypothetical protein
MAALCAYNSETTLPKKLESNIMRAEEKNGNVSTIATTK